MGLLTGSVSVTRFKVPPTIDDDAFGRLAFRDIDLASEVKESIGFLTFEPGSPYRIGANRLAFRLRIDRRRADSVQLRDRHKQLLQIEMESTGAPYVGSQKRSELRSLAEEELIVGRSPTSIVIECCIDDRILFVGSTSKMHLGSLQQALRRAGITTELLLPWIEKGLPEEFSDIPETMDPAASIYGCRFLKRLISDSEFLIEPENGYVRLAAADTRITLSGAVLTDLHRYLKEDAEVLSAKLLHKDLSLTLDATTYRLTAVRFPRPKNEHWTDDLDQRIEQIRELFTTLDDKFDRLS